jgi:hypothetical protein
MHRACITLFEQSRPASDLGVKLATAAAAAEEKVTAFPVPRRGYAWLSYGVGLAAAACIAFMVLHRPAATPLASAPAREEVVQINPAKAPAAEKAAVPAVATYYQPLVLVKHSVRPPLAGAVVAGAEEQPSLDWMNQIQFAPIAHISSEELLFDPHPEVQGDPRAFQSRRPFQGTVEKAAFQFQR